jgi:23S rRNA (cytidine1920-2'-O)/16S rRNA (cytidine1409-2'-O)-methyltransferase
VLDPARPRDVVTLVKPQFEVGRGSVGPGGIVRDRGLHRQVLETACARAAALGFPVIGIAASPIAGTEGNREFLMHLSPDRDALSAEGLDPAVDAALVSSAEGEQGQ